MLSIRLFGKFSVERDGQSVPGLDAARVQELFAFLLLNRGRAHPRESLASVLWSDSGAEQARKYLRQTLWQLQSAVHLVVAEPDWVRLDPMASFDFDVANFEEDVESLMGVAGGELQSDSAGLLRRASSVYTGDLLDGWYQDWCLFERERLQNMFMQTLDKLMVYCEKHGDFETGLCFGSRLLSFDHAHERTHRRLMRLHYLSGDRTAALRQYQRCATTLADELGVKPSRRTTELFEQIRADALDVPLAPAHATVDGAYNGVVEQIAGLQATLADLLLTLRQTAERRDDRSSPGTSPASGVPEHDARGISAPA